MEKLVRTGQSGSAIYGLSQLILAEADIIGNTIPLLKSGLERLSVSSSIYQSTAGTKSIDPYTKRLRLLDKQRNKDFILLRDYVKLFCESPIDEIAAKSQSIFPIFERYGLKLYTKNYSDESTGLSLLLDDLLSAQNKVIIIAIGAMPWVERLKNSASDFDICFAERNHNQPKTDSKKATAALNDMVSLIRILLDSFCLLEKDSADNNIQNRLHAINAAVVRFNTGARANRTRYAKSALNSKI